MKERIYALLPDRLTDRYQALKSRYNETFIAEYYRNKQKKKKYQKQINALCALYEGKEILGDSGLISLSKLKQKSGQCDNQTEEQSVCLMFLLDNSFLEAFKTLIYSLHKEESLIELPIVIITNDCKVLANDFVKSVAADIHYLTEDDLSVFAGMSNEKVSKKYRINYAPKYTFLKFFVFKNYGYKNHIFLDCDLLCLNSATQLLSFCGEVDFAITPNRDRRKLREFFNHNGSIISPNDAIKEYENYLLKSNYSLNEVNSGVMVIGERFIGDEIFNALVTLAKIEPYSKEQDVTNNLLYFFEDLKWKYLHPRYNVLKTLLDLIDETTFKRDRDEMVFIHYLTTNKPWLKDPEAEELGWLDSLWWDYYNEAEEFFAKES